MQNDNGKSKIQNIFFIFVLIFAFFVSPLFTQIAFAYNEKTTHPALTDEIVDFYNLLHPDKPLTSEQKEWIVEGSILEDTPPRWVNHFYDPIRKIGWVGEKAGELPSSLVRGLSLVGLSPEGALSSVNWVHNGAIQSQYSRYGGNHTWEQALNYFVNKNEKEAYITLGHILHLLEDMSVPDHSRNDTHAPLEIAGDDGSPFEDYLQKWNRGTIKSLNIASNLKASGVTAPAMSSVDAYLISLAEYSNKYFFSKDTINDPKYQLPKIIREDGDYGYGVDENGREFPLIKINTLLNNERKIEKIYSIRNKEIYHPILSAYFSRLAPKAVLYGVGVLELFFKQIPDAEVAKEFPSRLVRYDFSHVTPPSISIVGEGSKIVNATKLFVSSFVYVAQNGVAVVSGFANKRFNRIEEKIEDAKIKTAEIEPANLLTLDVDKLSDPQLAQNQTSIQTKNQSPISIAEIKNKVENASAEFQKKLSSLEASALSNALDLNSKKSVTNQTQNIYVGSSDSRGGDSPPISTVSTATTNTINTNNTTNTTNTTTSTATSTDSNTNNSSSTDSNSTSTGSTATSTATTNSTSSNVLIGEIQVSGVDSGDEFIELYNLTENVVDISSWSIQYIGGSGSNATKKNFESGNQISAKGFFLIARDKNASSSDGYAGEKIADLLHRTFSLSGASDGGKIYLVKNNETITGENDSDIVDKINYGFSVPSSNQSLERKALKNNNCVSAQNSGEYEGNGCDTNSNSDWEIRTSNPQNSQSLAEPRTAPSVSNFTGLWQSASSSINLSWDTAANIFYSLRELVITSWDTLFSATTTASYQKSITERGKDYSFSLTASDADNLSSASSTIIVNVLASQSPSAPSDITFSYDSANSVLSTYIWRIN